MDCNADDEYRAYSPVFELCPSTAKVLAAALPLLLNLCGPSINALALGSRLNFQLDTVHTLCAIQEAVASHASSVGAVCRKKLEHGQQEFSNALALLNAEMVFLSQNIRQGPVAKTVDVAQLALAVEYLL